VPNAGANDRDTPMLRADIWRTSFTNWQPCFRWQGDVRRGPPQIMTSRGVRRRPEDVEAIRRASSSSGQDHEELYCRSRRSSSMALITSDRAEEAGRVFAFFGRRRRGEVRQGLRGGGTARVDPLYVGLLTDGTLQAKERTRGYQDMLHYATTSTIRPTRSPRRVQAEDRAGGRRFCGAGFDTAAAQRRAHCDEGDFAKDALYGRDARRKIDSPRGPIASPRQQRRADIYLREAKGGLNATSRSRMRSRDRRSAAARRAKVLLHLPWREVADRAKARRMGAIAAHCPHPSRGHSRRRRA